MELVSIFITGQSQAKLGRTAQQQLLMLAPTRFKSVPLGLRGVGKCVLIEER